MADDRPIEDTAEQLARITREFDDFKTTMAARVTSRPTGDIEPTIRTVAKAGTLLCQGGTVSRATYPALWQFAQDQGLVGTWFTSGDGSTTFGLPDLRGRVFVGVGTLGADTYTGGGTGGSSTKTIGTTNLPAHDHGGSGGHDHGFGTNNTGGHGGHTSGTSNVVPPGSGVTLPSFYDNNFGSHSHSGTTDFENNHTHGSVGNGTAFDVRQAYIGGNWLIYT